MHWLAKLRIASKLQLACGMLIILFLLAASVGYYGIAQQQALMDTLYTQLIARTSDEECHDTFQATTQLSQLTDSLRTTTAQFNV